MIGETEVRVLFSPGHTLASITYVTDAAAFVHDTLMMPDIGTSRADFPGGSSAALYQSIERILALPDDTALFTGHDYEKDDRDAQCCATVAEHKVKHVHVGDNRSEADFVKLRDTRDATLPPPEIDAWVIWNVWQVASPVIADQVTIERNIVLYRVDVCRRDTHQPLVSRCTRVRHIPGRPGSGTDLPAPRVAGARNPQAMKALLPC